MAGNFAEVKFLNLLHDPGRAFVSPFKTPERVPPRPVQK
jgi:hypothetical protein